MTATVMQRMGPTHWCPDPAVHSPAAGETDPAAPLAAAGRSGQGWLLLLPVLASNGWWALIHEATHGVLLVPATLRAVRVDGWLVLTLYGLAWWQLPDDHRRSGAGYQGNWIAAVLNQFRGHIPELRLLPGEGGRP